MTDKKIVLKHLEVLEDCIKQLSRHKKCSVNDLLADLDLRWAVEHGLQLAIQNILDISTHILVSYGLSGLKDYTTVLDQMGARNVIPQRFAKKIRGMASFRNILVHDYIDVDTKKLHIHLVHGVDDFKLFSKYIISFLNKKKTDGLRP